MYLYINVITLQLSFIRVRKYNIPKIENVHIQKYQKDIPGKNDTSQSYFHSGPFIKTHGGISRT